MAPPRITNPREGYPEWFRQLVRDADAKGDRTRVQIAEEFGISTWSIAEWCGPSKRFVHGFKAVARHDRYYDLVREMHWEGYTYHYIAKKTGIPVSTVWDWINQPKREK
jgi:hypothetical protein